MRTRKAKTRIIQPDSRYQSTLVTRLIHRAMQSGKKTVASRLVYQALEEAAGEIKKKPAELIEEVVAKIMPQMEVRSRRVGGASYQVPMPVKPHRGYSLAIRWLVLEANKRPSKQFQTFAAKLKAEMLDALQEQGGAIEKRNTTYKMAEANKAFAHFRW